MTDEEYNDWFSRGYDANACGEDCPSDTTRDQKSAWRDGYYSAAEELDE